MCIPCCGQPRPPKRVEPFYKIIDEIILLSGPNSIRDGIDILRVVETETCAPRIESLSLSDSLAHLFERLLSAGAVMMWLLLVQDLAKLRT